MADWENDRASQFTRQWINDDIRYRADQARGGGINFQGPSGYAGSAADAGTVWSWSIGFGVIGALFSFSANYPDPLLFAGFCFVMVFLITAAIGLTLKFIVMLLTGQLFKAREPKAAPAEKAIIETAEGSFADAAAPAFEPAPITPAAPAIPRAPSIFKAVTVGTALGAAAGVAIAAIAGPDIPAWEGVARIAPIGLVIGAIVGVMRRMAFGKKVAKGAAALKRAEPREAGNPS